MFHSPSRNTTTDIKAYVASGIPKERIYIIGPHGGKGGSVKIDNFTDHIPEIFAFPDADPPMPYTELVFTAVPGYKKRRTVPKKGAPFPSPIPPPRSKLRGAL